MIIRAGTAADLDAYLAVQEEEWGEGMAATRAQLESRLEHVGGDLLMVVEHDGEVVAGGTFVRLSRYDIDDQRSWGELTDDGWCANHDPDGRDLFGVDLSVSRRAPRSTSARYFAAMMETAIRLGVDGVYWGSRLPRYHRHANRMSADEYAWSRTSRGRYLDPEIEIYSRIPGVELTGVVADYFKDEESLDYGAIFGWTNPLQRYRFIRRLAGPIVAFLYRRDRRRRSKGSKTGSNRRP